METKYCKSCKIEKTIDQFRPYKKNKPSINASCIICVKARERRFYQNNKQKWKDREAKLRLDSPDALKKKNRDAATRWRENPENIRKKKIAYIVKRYGISVEQYEQMDLEQNGLCKICDQPPDGRFERLHVDHDHTTNEVRGLLCFSCNTGLGNFKDNAETLLRASSYLLSR